FSGNVVDRLKDAVPSLRRVAVLHNARGEVPGREKTLNVLREAAIKLGLTLTEKPAKSVNDVEEAVHTLSKQTTDGIFVLVSGLFAEPCKRIAAIATQERVPLSGCEEEKGIQLSYGPHVYRTGHREAWNVDKIHTGQEPRV